MFIGEAPGADEDQQGEPFVGRAGQLLTRILKAMNFAREDVYIANILKCRPDMPAGSFGNRPPTPTEMQTCRPYLMEQIEIIQPSVLVALGAVAVEGLLGTRGTMRELRGRWHTYNSIPLMITYHPAYLLRNQAPSEKRKVWEDMLQVMERLSNPSATDSEVIFCSRFAVRNVKQMLCPEDRLQFGPVKYRIHLPARCERKTNDKIIARTSREGLSRFAAKLLGPAVTKSAERARAD